MPESAKFEYVEKQWMTSLLVIFFALILLASVPQLRSLIWSDFATEPKLGSSGIFVVWTFCLLILLFFNGLTIRVEPAYLRWYFGSLGFPAWKIALRDISSVEASSCAWYEGKGIRVTRSGMLYNASGNLAIKIYTKDGKILRLGTADPQRLLHVLNHRIAG